MRFERRAQNNERKRRFDGESPTVRLVFVRKNDSVDSVFIFFLEQAAAFEERLQFVFGA